MVIPPIIIIGAQVLLCVLAVIHARKNAADIPYAAMTCYVVGTDLVRWALLLLLPNWEVILFPLIDLIWVSHFGSYVWMARRMAGKAGNMSANCAVVVHGSLTAAVSADFVMHRRWWGWYSFRLAWIRLSAVVLLGIAFRDLIKTVERGDKCLGMGLGLAAVAVDMFQVLQYNSKIQFVVYQAAMVCYMAASLALLSRSIYKEKVSHA
jgi:hypothetical protein